VPLRDVVEVPAVPTVEWRQRATEAVVSRAVELEQSGRHLLLAGDPVAAGEAVAAPSAAALDGIACCLLDVSPQAQAQRLERRGDPPALTSRHQAFAEWMRRHAEDPLHMTQVLTTGGWAEMRWDRLKRLAPTWQMHVIDTTEMNAEAVADAVLDWCRRVLARDVPLLQLA
jgi:hypothetical protein